MKWQNICGIIEIHFGISLCYRLRKKEIHSGDSELKNKMCGVHVALGFKKKFYQKILKKSKNINDPR